MYYGRERPPAAEDTMETRGTTQSFGVSEEEKLLTEVLAAAMGVKAANFIRQMFYRGLAEHLREPAEYSDMFEQDVLSRVRRLVDNNAELSHFKKVISDRRALEKRERRVYAKPLDPDESESTRSDESGQKVTKKGRRI